VYFLVKANTQLILKEGIISLYKNRVPFFLYILRTEIQHGVQNGRRLVIIQ